MKSGGIDMAKPTQKELIEELKLKNMKLEEDCSKLIKACQDMEKRLNIKIDKSEDAFIASPTYLQMKRKICDLESKCDMLNKQLKRKNARENQKHNERGAGAKTRFTSPTQLEEINLLYDSGIKMTDIAQHMGCSVATISRALKNHVKTES